MSNFKVDNTNFMSPKCIVDVNIFNPYKIWIGPRECPHTMKSKRACYSKNKQIYLSPLRVQRVLLFFSFLFQLSYIIELGNMDKEGANSYRF